ncbi:septum formation family protein [Nocardioides donggukensis]|uniref:septum formation family protein n=1 Tax=Nocardioides donggukensis TaxID=2774019 RepID=UPI00191E09B4|nr:septum formation family protein [Nocardioides donggukensis]
MNRATAGPLAALALVAGLAGCQQDPTPTTGPTPAPSEASSGPSNGPTTGPPSSTAEPAPALARPKAGACYRLSYDAALAPTNESRSVSCPKGHNARTFHVGTLRTVVDGHLLAVDSRRVRAQPATECPKRVGTFLGGSPDDLRLSMLRTVWFSPTVEASDAGEHWFRCDVVALAAPEELAPLSGVLRGVLGTDRGRTRFGTCGTAKPGTEGFRRVICSRPHSWRAVETVDVGPAAGGGYPGKAAAQSAGESRCEDVGRERADDALSFSWGYEWPTEAQWDGGQRYGLCWVPTG